MISRIDLRGSDADPRTVLPRAALDVDAALDTVRPICADVRHRGADALRDLGERLDGVRPAELRVPAEALTEALAGLDPDVRAALEESVRRARLVHADQRRPDVTTQVVPGGTVTERWLPVSRVGLYVPGGLAVYPSSVVMNVVPAQVAGVVSLAVASPPQRQPGRFYGLPHPTILAACALLGVGEVYAVGGAQAVAMFAYGAAEADGTPVCARADLVTGPGNIYVAAAKRLLRGRIGIDAEAGPTEIAVLADDSADPRHVAADLVSQAEHDTIAAAVLVTDSEALAAAVERELEEQVAAAKHGERIRTALAGSQSGIVLVDDIDHGLRVVDAYAAEHLEIQTRDARAVALRVRNAGAVFVGPWAPVSLGDYVAGSNHVLPTGGCACFSSGLSVQTFLRGIHVVDYDEAALAGVGHHVVALAGAEDLPAHGTAVEVRFPDGFASPDADGSGSAGARRAAPVPTGPAGLAGLPVREDLRGRSPYGAPQLDVPVRLNTNENPHPPSAALVADLAERVAAAAAALNRYPDRDAGALRTDLAAYLARTTGAPVAPAQVWAANGSNEVLQQLLQAFGGPGRRALAFEPTYTMHRLISEGTGTAYVGLPRAPDAPLGAAEVTAAIAEHRPDVVFLCSPNNPTGAAVGPAVVAAAYDAVLASGAGMVVVDEAYAEFSHQRSAVALLAGRPRLVVTRTMSKAFAFAGARLGYLAADPAVIEALLLVRLPYHLSTITQAAARAALAHADELLASVEAVKAQRDRMVTALTALGLEVVASDANFLLVGRFADRRATWQALLDRGVLVRDVGLAGWLRVSAGTEAETTAFLDAMAALR